MTYCHERKRIMNILNIFKSDKNATISLSSDELNLLYNMVSETKCDKVEEY